MVNQTAFEIYREYHLKLEQSKESFRRVFGYDLNLMTFDRIMMDLWRDISTALRG